MINSFWSRLLTGLLLAAAIVACQTAEPTLEPVPTEASVIKGYGISPLGFPADYSRFPDFLAEVGSLPNGGVMFNGA